MPDYVIPAVQANAAGIAVCRFQLNRSGVVWVVSQISVRTSPARQNTSVTITRNGQTMTTTSVVPATAGGQPFYRLNNSDVLEATYTGLTVGDSAITTLSYSESLWGQPNDGNVI
jgi:hypothetical protein